LRLRTIASKFLQATGNSIAFKGAMLRILERSDGIAQVVLTKIYRPGIPVLRETGTRGETQEAADDSATILPDREPKFFKSRSNYLPYDLAAVFVLVTIVVAVFPVTIVMVMFLIFMSFSFIATVPLTIMPMITVMLVPFAIVSTRYSNGELLC
jgi:hypothetical protein